MLEELRVDIWFVGIDVKPDTVKLASAEGIEKSAFVDQATSGLSAYHRNDAPPCSIDQDTAFFHCVKLSFAKQVLSLCGHLL
jgi:hypothetical protein